MEWSGNVYVEEYLAYLKQEERSESTRKQYERELRRFLVYVKEILPEDVEIVEDEKKRSLSKEQVIAYKESLKEKYQPSTINVILAALNGFFDFIGKPGLKVKQLKIQRSPYCRAEKELTKTEYHQLVGAARGRRNEQLMLILQTIGGTGIRVSELQYITVEAVEAGQAVVSLKGKNRVILISGKLQKYLKEYIRKQKVQSGAIFVTKRGKPIHRSNVWRMMKSLCKEAGVEEEKVFPHNLRHLFARSFYAIAKDIAKLADLLGHSSINTTRIYIVSTGAEHRKMMASLGLVV